jgi:hypothetical protein
VLYSTRQFSMIRFVYANPDYKVCLAAALLLEAAPRVAAAATP